MLFTIKQTTTTKRSKARQILTVRPLFAIYLGWATVATIANISSFFVQLGYQEGFLGLSADSLTVAILVVATLIGTATALLNSTPAYSLELVWAFYGIYSRHTSAFEWNFQYPNIILATQVLMALLVVASAGAVVRWLRETMHETT